MLVQGLVKNGNTAEKMGLVKNGQYCGKDAPQREKGGACMCTEVHCVVGHCFEVAWFMWLPGREVKRHVQ